MLVGHGTRDERGTRQFFELGERLAIRTDLPVAPCLLEFQSPTIKEAWQTLVARGVKHVHVAPLLLFAAGHAKSDIPDEVIAAAAETPGITWDQSRPLSRGPAMIDVVCERINQTLAKHSARRSSTAVLMIGRGSRDPCARTDMFVLTEVVKTRVQDVVFETAFYAMTTPTVPEMLDRLAADGRFDTIVVHPHLLFSGLLYEAIERQCQEARDRHRGIDVICGDYLGPVDEIADSVIRRTTANETRSGLNTILPSR